MLVYLQQAHPRRVCRVSILEEAILLLQRRNKKVSPQDNTAEAGTCHRSFFPHGSEAGADVQPILTPSAAVQRTCWTIQTNPAAETSTKVLSCPSIPLTRFRRSWVCRDPGHSKGNRRSVALDLAVMATPDGPQAASRLAEESGMQKSSLGDEDPLVQYVVLRKDLTVKLNWPLGAVVAQACHAAVDALGISMIRDGDEAKTYLAAGSSMITVVLQVPGEPELLKLRDKLQQSQIGHSLWKEEPEKIPTALASVPIRKSAGKVFKGLKLLS